jgi:hypothetical protein
MKTIATLARMASRIDLYDLPTVADWFYHDVGTKLSNRQVGSFQRMDRPTFAVENGEGRGDHEKRIVCVITEQRADGTPEKGFVVGCLPAYVAEDGISFQRCANAGHGSNSNPEGSHW